MAPATRSQALIDFFDSRIEGKDPQGRMLDDILHWEDIDFEYSHDYVQNVFPLPEASQFNGRTFIVNEDVYNAFRQRADLQTSLDKAFTRMCSFYGLDAGVKEDGTQYVKRSEDFDRKNVFWLNRFNHNHLRITRIIRSLRVLGLSQQAEAFMSFMENDTEIAKIVSSRSMMYWRRAAERPLNLPPDEDDESAEGISWLKDKT